MKTIATGIKDVVIIQPDVYEDDRGFFIETFNVQRYNEFGVTEDFVQDNLSFSFRGVLRGLHYQVKKPQAKLIQVVKGEVYDVAVDLRKGSKTFGEWIGHYLSSKDKQQLFIPAGFAHGFCVTSETAQLAYKCSSYYDSDDEYGILWSDPDLKIKWPIKNPIISDKDKKLLRLSELAHDFLPQVEN